MSKSNNASLSCLQPNRQVEQCDNRDNRNRKRNARKRKNASTGDNASNKENVPLATDSTQENYVEDLAWKEHVTDNPASNKENVNKKNISDTKIRSPLATDSTQENYVEDLAWKEHVTDNPATENVPILPPPDALPGLPNEMDELSCTWSFDEATRILRAKLKPGEKQFSNEAKELLKLMMERDDIAVITEGHCQSLDRCLWNLESIKAKNGEKYHHRFRLFQRYIIDSASETEPRYEYREVDNDLAMTVKDYFGYLEKREKVLASKSLRKGSSTYEYTNERKKVVELDVLDDIIYMLDYDIKQKLPSQFQDFKDNFALPEFLPGGRMCAMNTVSIRELQRADCDYEASPHLSLHRLMKQLDPIWGQTYILLPLVHSPGFI